MSWKQIAEAPRDGRILKVRLPVGTGQGATTRAYWDEEEKAWCYETGRKMAVQPIEYRDMDAEEAIEHLATRIGQCLELEVANGTLVLDGELRETAVYGSRGMIVPIAGHHLVVTVAVWSDE